MKKKEILKKVWLAFSFLWMGYLTGKAIRGEADILDTIWLTIFYAVLAIYIVRRIVFLIMDISLYFSEYEVMLKIMLRGLENLDRIHKEWYVLYLAGDREEAEKYSAKIERTGRSIIKLAEGYKTSRNRKRARKMQEIIDQTQKLMTTVC